MDYFEERCKHEQYSKEMRIIEGPVLIMDIIGFIIQSIDELYPKDYKLKDVNDVPSTKVGYPQFFHLNYFY